MLKGLVKKYFNLIENKENTSSTAKQSFDTATLVDGTVVTNQADTDFAPGDTLYVLTEEGNYVTAPEGEHSTESGIALVVDAQGIITEVRRPDEAVEAVSEEVMQEVDTMPEITKEFPIDIATLMQSVEEVIEQKVNEAIASLITEVDEMKKKMAEYMSAAASAPTLENRFNKIQEVKKENKNSVTNDSFGFRKAQMDLVVNNFKNRKIA